MPRIKITFKEDITFLGIPSETYPKGYTWVGEILGTMNRGIDIIFLPDTVERKYQIPKSSIEIEELKDGK